MKKHRVGVCPACRQRVRVTQDGRCYRHLGKSYVQPELRACAGSNGKAERVVDDEVEARFSIEGTQTSLL